jgi:phage nucleotide-binding protein
MTFADKIKKTSQVRHDAHLKFLVYGAAGVGKTYLARTLDGPALVGSCESGLASLADTDIDFIEIKNLQDLRDMYLFLSREKHQYQWAVLDSISEMAEMALTEALTSNKDPRKAYGEMQENIIKLLRAFRSLPINIFFAAKQRQDNLDSGVKFQPAMPGATLTEKRPIAHDFDYVFALITGDKTDPNQPAPRYLVTEPTDTHVAKSRDPLHALQPLEPADFGAIRAKIIQSYIKGENEIRLQSVSFGDLPTSEEKSGSGKYKPIPDGEYTFQIVETDYDITQSGFERINLKCEIVGSNYAGKTVFHKFFIGHPDPARKQAVEIGLADLKALCTYNGKSSWPTSHADLQAWKFNAKLTYRAVQWHLV